MRRLLRRVPLQDLISRLQSYNCGCRNTAVHLLEFSRANATSSGDTPQIFTNVLMSYGGELIVTSIKKQIINALKLGERDRAFNLLIDLCDGNQALRADDFVDILEYCARSPDPLFAMETWRKMEEKKISLNSKCYLDLTRALCNGGHLEQAFGLIKFIGESHDIDPSLPMYSSLLGASTKMLNGDLANQCLDLMESGMIRNNEFSYAALLNLAVLQQNLYAIQEIWKDYTKHYSPSIQLLRKFIWSFIRLKDLKSARETLLYMVGLVHQVHTFSVGTTEWRLRSSRLDIPIPLKCEPGLQNFALNEKRSPIPLKESTCNTAVGTSFGMGNKQVESIGVDELAGKNLLAKKLLRWSFSDIIHACAQTKNCELAEQLFSQMQILGLQPSSHTYDGLIKAIIRERGFNAGLKVLKIMQSKGLKPKDSTLSAISIACSQASELDLAEAFLDQISECSYPHPFNAFFGACNKMDQPQRAIRMFAKVKQLKIQPDVVMHELLFALFGSATACYYHNISPILKEDSAKRIKALDIYMKTNGCQHSPISMMNLLKALGAEGKTEELKEYLLMALNMFALDNVSLGTLFYNRVLHSLVKRSQSQEAIKTFKDMRRSGFPSDSATYAIMLDCCYNIHGARSALALVSLMLREGFCLQLCHYTTLIKVLFKWRNFKEVLKCLDRGRSEGIQFNIITYNTILEQAFVKKKIPVTEFVVEMMRRCGIQPDPTTCRYVFGTYTKCGFHNTAIEAMQVLCMRMISKNDAELEEKRMKFEELVVAPKRDTEMRILKLFNDFEEDLAVALLSLRWCAILGFEICWSPDRTPWAKRLSDNYNTISGGGD